jgi:hypothetical protein
MPGPHKITLADAKAQGDFMLMFYCQNMLAYCSHSGEMRLDEAVARWGGGLRLDQVPARCTRCGSRDFIDVRARPPKREGGSPLGKIIERV